ncbi:MAG: fibronectin type III domain-containing protein [Flavobacteriales bacterium]|nr:MAG: fibronectin type III domain-containing protein [Flavobacteriales bacterium]
MNNIKLSLFKLIPTALLALLRTVIANLTGNANFPTPKISVADMILQADALEAAITAATNGDRQSRILRDNLVMETRDMLRVQADYVRSVCNGDKAMLESSGFELAKQREPIEKVGVPQYVTAETGKGAGEVEFRWRGVHGAHGYTMERGTMNAQGQMEWEALPFTTRTRNILTGLDSHQLYSLRVTAVGVNGPGLVSAVVQAVAA